MRLLLILTCILSNYTSSYSQKTKEGESSNKSQPYSYAFVTVENKGFGRKLKVNVDLGDTPGQEKAGKEYSEKLTDKKSYAAILNYMGEHDFELIESRETSFSFQGTGGTSSIIFIMRKKDVRVDNQQTSK